MNYDSVRIGRTLEIQAKRFAERAIKDMEPEQAAREQPALFEQEYDRLVRGFNQDKVRAIPGFSLSPNDENKDQMVIRFKLKTTQDKAANAIKQRDKFLTNPDFSIEKAVEALEKGVEIVELTLEEADKRDDLARTPSELITASGESMTGEELVKMLDGYGIDVTEASKILGVTYQTVNNWTKNGVPNSKVREVRQAFE
jgi:DNA-binding transcriptional regulator YiaG